MRKDALLKTALAAAFAGLVLWGGLPLLRHRHHDFPIVKGPGVTAVLRLSDFSPGLKGTRATPPSMSSKAASRAARP